MTPERAKELLPIIQAFAEGKPVQYRAHKARSWETMDYLSFEDGPECYRIKPETVKSRRYLYESTDPNWPSTYVGIALQHHDPRLVADARGFIRWIDYDWVEHEVE